MENKHTQEQDGPVQSHDPDQRVWEYDGTGQKIYKKSQGYPHKTLYTEEHYTQEHLNRKGD